jgi:S1-C subfamily serine protease
MFAYLPNTSILVGILVLQTILVHTVVSFSPTTSLIVPSYKYNHFNIHYASESDTLPNKAKQQNERITTDSVFVTKATNLDKNLNNDEKSVVNVVRLVGPSVATVSSYSIPNTNKQDTTIRKSKSPPPNSSSMGSGSSFVIAQDGYFLTNYHVVQRAYQMQQAETKWKELYTNVTSSVPSFLQTTISSPPRLPRKGQVYLRFASSQELLPCRIVDVRPEYDIAVLYLNATTDTSINIPNAIPIGESSTLLVGQSVLAIGNPFGLDQTVTKGVVSALDRSMKGIAGNDIKGCIQTDASINPGNSGGPLLNSAGEVIGVNTMIISTSGSNAGIGFAVPIEGFWRDVEDILHKDRMNNEVLAFENRRRKRGWLGVKVVSDERLEMSFKRQLRGQSCDGDGVVILEVEDNSPASNKGIVPVKMDGVKVRIGDRIVAVSGNKVQNSRDLAKELKNKVVGEKISLTVEDIHRDRRVVYVTLGERNNNL